MSPFSLAFRTKSSLSRWPLNSSFLSLVACSLSQVTTFLWGGLSGTDMTAPLQGEQRDCCPDDVWPGKTPDLPCSGLQLHAGEWRAKAAHWFLLHACRSVGHTLQCISTFSMELTLFV